MRVVRGRGRNTGSFIELGASEEQLDFPIVYASARNGVSGFEPDEMTENMQPVFDTIINHVPAGR